MLPSAEELRHLYVDQELSIGAIAEKYGTYPSKIRRLLVKHNIPRRDKDQAQQLAIKNGRGQHPTKGKPVPPERKTSFSKTSSAWWQNLSEEEKERRREEMRERLRQRGGGEKMRDNSHEKIREASRRGSKLERYLLAYLRQGGFQVEFHRDQLVSRERLEIDLYLPHERVAIEVNGPSHYEPIWGEDKLARARESDRRKAGLLRAGDIHLVVIKSLRSNLPRWEQEKLAADLAQVVRRLAGVEQAQVEEIEV